MADEITRRGYRVSGETLNRWVRQDKEVPAVVERIVFDLFTISGQQESPPPWAEAMERRMTAELRLNRALIEDAPDEVAAMRAEIDELRRDGLPRDGSPPMAGPSRPGSAGGMRP